MSKQDLKRKIRKDENEEDAIAEQEITVIRANNDTTNDEADPLEIPITTDVDTSTVEMEESEEQAEAPKNKKLRGRPKAQGGASKKKKSTKASPKKKSIPVITDADDDDEDEEEYEVEAIVDHTESKGKILYKIRWKGYGPETDTWEPEDTVSCPTLIKKYHNSSDYKNKAAKVATKGSKKKLPNKGTPSKARKNGLATKIDDSDQEWEVEKIVDVRNRKGAREFLIHWKGYSADTDSWEPEANLNCHDLIEKFTDKLEKNKPSATKGLRVKPKNTKQFIATNAKKQRLSKRNNGRQRTTYFEDE